MNVLYLKCDYVVDIKRSFMIQDLCHRISVGAEAETPLQMNQALAAGLQKCCEVIRKPSRREGPFFPSCVKRRKVGRGVP